MSEQVVDHAAKEHAVDAGRQQAHRRSSPHRGAAPSRGSTVPSTMAATSSMKVHEREQHGKHYSHCSVNHHVHSSVAMAALETTPTAAESERDFISKFRARQCTRNRLAQPAQTTAKVGADFRVWACMACMGPRQPRANCEFANLLFPNSNSNCNHIGNMRPGAAKCGLLIAARARCLGSGCKVATIGRRGRR